MRIRLMATLVALLPVITFGQYVPPIVDSSFGWMLPGSSNCKVWWCEATYKVGQSRALPVATNAQVSIAAARNEYEPFQIVLRSVLALSNVTVSVSDFIQQGGSSNIIAATNVEACLVEYVPVVVQTDAYGTNGLFPDPLPPLADPFNVPAGSNQPVWITVYVPKDAPAGDYLAQVTIQADATITIPLHLQVLDFALSDVTHTRTAYYADVGVYWDRVYSVSPWHLLSNLADQRYVWDLYMQNFRKHRVAPYAPHYYAPISWTLTNGQFIVDFSAFDEAMTRYLDEFGFNSFNLMGVKTPDFPTTLGGYKQFTPEYRELFGRLITPIMAHLREQGWAEKVYCYWIDEPTSPDAISNTIAGMTMLAEHAPGLNRLLTVNYESAPAFARSVDLWVAYPNLGWGLDFPGRDIAGEESWWYYCLGPTAPRPNNFVDHPAVNHRIRFWLAEKYGIQGDLYWSTAHWVSNPWTNANTSSHGDFNGDGTLLYPPTRTLPTTPQLVGPINSIRWELIREGLEDAEYFWLLKQRLEESRLRLGPAHPAVEEGQAALQAALELVPSLEVFERNPQVLYAARMRVANAIAALDSGAPFIVRQPVSRAVESGKSTTLRVEVLGWPLPLVQWRLNGTDLPGATNAVLAITNAGPGQTGAYVVVASNAFGVVTSQVAQVEGRWSDVPRIVQQPQDLVRETGTRAVFSATVVSANPVAYTWQFNGSPLSPELAANGTLVITNLDVSNAGEYSVVISNAAGMVTSSVARLAVVLANPIMTLVSRGALWRYHDADVDLGAAWREPAYDDSSWSQGPSPLGYGNGDEATIVGNDSNPKTVYYRKAFEVSQLPLPALLSGLLKRDDGAVVYLNGTEVFRNNLPGGPLTHDTPATGLVNGAEESAFLPFTMPAELLRLGTNVLAVEVHQNAGETSQAFLPCAFWSFNENKSPWGDGIGTNKFMSVGAQLIAAPGRIGGCASNSASATDYLIAADSPELSYSGPFTVGGWFAWAPSSPESVCLRKEDEFKLSYTGTTINRYRFEVNGTYVQDGTPGTTAGQWRFVVGWYDGTNAHIQVNNGTVYSVPATAPIDTANPLIALKKADSNGGIAADEVFLYKRVLAASERTMLYNNLPLPNANDLSFDLMLTGTVAQAPLLLTQPVSITRQRGENAAFSVSMISATPATGQWWFNGSPLANATNTLLSILGVTTNQVGTYLFVATNSTSSVTSSPAILDIYDRDEDQLPNEWETMFGLDPWDPADALLDNDSDGLNNLAEYLAGKNPTVFDNLHFTKYEYLPDGHFRIFVWAEPGKTYLLEASTNLTGWDTALQFTCTNRIMVVTDPNSSQLQRRFYRVAPLPPPPGQ